MSEWVMIIVVGILHATVAIDHLPFRDESSCLSAAEAMATNLKGVATRWTISCHRTRTP